MTLDQLVHLGAAVTIVVQLGAAPVEEMEILVGVGPAAGAGEGDDIVLAHDPGKPVGGIDRLKLALDVDLLQLIDQDYCRIPQIWEVAHRYLDLERVIGPITELMHDLAGIRTVFLYVGTVARQLLQDIRRHTP